MTIKTKPNYYVLLVRDFGYHWSVEFGSYERSEVQYERDEYRTHYNASDLKIIKTSPLQSDIDAIVNSMNHTD